MAEKLLNARFQQKTDTTVNWNKAGEKEFIPKKGEIIVYQDTTGSVTITKTKVGDGINIVTNLPFQETDVTEIELDTTLTQPGKAADAKAVGDRLENISMSGASDWSDIENKPSIRSGRGLDSIEESYGYAGAEAAHAEGNGRVYGSYSHAEGYGSYVYGSYSHAEGYGSVASANGSHAEGMNSYAYGTASHAEGSQSYANADYSHAEGLECEASGHSSHAEGYYTRATGVQCHAEGAGSAGLPNIASGYASHVEGRESQATGYAAHAEGFRTEARGDTAWGKGATHAEGCYTKATQNYQHVQGKYNKNYATDGTFDSGNFAHIVGNGSSDTVRSNAHTLDWSGNAWFAGDVYIGSKFGTNQDAGSKKLATEEYVDKTFENIGTLPVPEELVVNTLKINGKIYETEEGEQVQETSLEVEGPVQLSELSVSGLTQCQTILSSEIDTKQILLTSPNEDEAISTSIQVEGAYTSGDYFIIDEESGDIITSTRLNNEKIKHIQDNYYNPENQPNYPVTSVNGKTGEVQLIAADVGALPESTFIPATPEDIGALPNTTRIPSKTSELTNDSGFITSAPSSRIRVVRVPSADEGGQSGTIKLEENTVYQFLSGSEPKVLKCYNSDNEVINTLSYQMFTIYCGGMGDNIDLVPEGSLDKRAKQAYLVYVANNTKSNSILGLPEYDAGYMVFKKNWPDTDNVNENFRVEVSYPAGSVYMIQSQEV